jgi:hypothetical protein
LGVFEQGPRIDERPPRPKESAYAYLNRSARTEAERERARIEEWFERYPAAEGRDLALRLRSRLDDQHRAALFELRLHELLVGSGHQLAIEPKLPHSWKSPDFLIDGRLYLEAVMAAGADLGTVLKRKANRYGPLDLPFVIAVQWEGGEDLQQVLDAFWHGPRGPQRRGVSAVLAVDPEAMRLVLNPWAERPLGSGLFPWRPHRNRPAAGPDRPCRCGSTLRRIDTSRSAWRDP